MEDIKESECNYYEVLDVNRYASQSEIEEAFKKKLREYDVNKLKYFGEKIRNLAEKETKLIKKAYEILSDPEERKDYNQTLKIRQRNRRGRTQSTKGYAKKQAETHNNRAIEYWNGQQYQMAILEWKKGIEIAPSMAELYHNLANAFLNLERYDKAILLWERTVELHPNLAEAYNNLGCAYYQIGEPELAAKNWKKVVELEPSCEQARKNLNMLTANSLVDLSQYEIGHSNDNNSKKGVLSKVFGKFKKS